MKQRIQDEYILEQYEPMTTKYWKRNKKPNINLLDCPFASDRQLEDQRFLIEQNKNPRGLEPGKNDKPRSIKIAAKIGVSNSVHTKAKVVNEIVREASGVHNYTLVPPIVGKVHEKIEIDPDTHPLMKPYREQSNTNPIMCSFGHRPKSASRTFHPGTMKIRLSKGEVAQPAAKGRNGFGLPPSVLAKLLHAPKIHHPGEEFEETTNNTLYDPHNLFLSNDKIFDEQSSRKVKSEKLLTPLPPPNDLKIGEQSWSTTLPQENEQEIKYKKKLKSPKKFQNDVDWNNHFHVIEKPSNERFELKKSGIAELKLLPLKERLTRFAAISVRDTVPQPFCSEKKLTDSLILNGKASNPQDLYRIVATEQHHRQPHELVYDRTENPFYDAEVEYDLQTIQRKYREKEEMKKKKLRQKMIKAAIASIPHVDYHPDDVVIEMAKESLPVEETAGIDEGTSLPSKSPNFERKQEEITMKIESNLLDMNTTSKKSSSSSSIPSKKKTKKNIPKEKILDYQNVYGPTLGPLEGLEAQKKKYKSSLSWKSTTSTSSNSKNNSESVKDESDLIYTHVMQTFDEYFINENEKEKMRKEWENERNEREKQEIERITRVLNTKRDSHEEQEEPGTTASIPHNHQHDIPSGGDYVIDEDEEERYDDQQYYERSELPREEEESVENPYRAES